MSFSFKTALNASTLFPYGLDVREQVRIGAEAGYEGIELWVRDILYYLENYGTAKQLRTYIADTGISIANAIGFFAWTDADEEKREQGFEQAKREMRMLAELGCPAIAAPPFGEVEGVTLDEMAGHFARLAGDARRIGIEPYLEFWGRAKKLSKLSEAVYIAMECRMPDIKILLDPFHMYTGGSDPEGLKLLTGASIGIVHVNDYPASPTRETISDRDRVFPGEGVAPTSRIAELLYNSGYRGFLSLELFIESYGGLSALEVARKGIETIRHAYRTES
jgi:sugar phosphate isomerase/epimerase